MEATTAAEVSSHRVVQAAAELAIRVVGAAAMVATREEAVSSLRWGQGVAVAVSVPLLEEMEAMRPQRALAPLPITQRTPSSAQSSRPPKTRKASGLRPREWESLGRQPAWIRSQAGTQIREQ